MHFHSKLFSATLCRYVFKSVEMYRSIGGQRSFIGLDNLESFSGLLSQLVEGKTVSPCDVQAAERLVRKGLLLKTGDRAYAFISPLHMHYYLVQVIC